MGKMSNAVDEFNRAAEDLLGRPLLDEKALDRILDDAGCQPEITPEACAKRALKHLHNCSDDGSCSAEALRWAQVYDIMSRKP